MMMMVDGQEKWMNMGKSEVVMDGRGRIGVVQLYSGIRGTPLQNTASLAKIL
jgi:hypothetical protein